MQTKLIEINYSDNFLRGILTTTDGKCKHGVLCLSGFERCSSTEKKFKTLADNLTKKDVATLRLDFSGTGLSDGDFKDISIDKFSAELMRAITFFHKEIGVTRISFVAHSLGGYILAKQLESIRNLCSKIILLAPALNQKDLLRYWFVTGKYKKIDPLLKITWNNYQDYFDEAEFLNDCRRTDRMTKTNYVKPDYFMQNKEADFSGYFTGNEKNIFYVHGDKDSIVPIESLNVNFVKKLMVIGGDHDLERPDMIEQWLEEVVKFIGSD